MKSRLTDMVCFNCFNFLPMKTARNNLKNLKTLAVAGSLALFTGIGSAHAQAAISVDSFQKISALEGGFGAGLDPVDLFGHGVANIGDVDGDGITDLAVGAFGDDDGGGNTGAVWILFLNADGTVKAKQKISATQGGFGGSLYGNAVFGASLDGLGDFDGDGVPDIVVGNYGDDDGGLDRGAVWIIFLNSNGTVKGQQKISSTQGFFGTGLSNNDQFGHDVANIGDLDGDGITDIAVGAWLDDDGGTDRGAVWVLFLNADGTVKSKQQISDTQGGFGGTLFDNDNFGSSIADIGDVNGDGVQDLAVSAEGDDDGGPTRGSVWILFMNIDGTVNAEQKISSTQGGFTGPIHDADLFGWSVSQLGDIDLDGIPDIVVGSRQDDDGGTNTGAIWLLFLNADGTVKAEQKISALQGGLTGALDPGVAFGTSVTLMGDLNGDGIPDLAVGAINDSDGGNATGAVWILFLDRTIEVSLDIKPASCPNPVNTGHGGVLPVAIPGTGTLDVSQVDPSTVQLEGVSPLRWSVEDVATPYAGNISNPPARTDCTTEGADGFGDLTLKFDKHAVVAALEAAYGPLSDGQVVIATFTGKLWNGTDIHGQDVVWTLVKK